MSDKPAVATHRQRLRERLRAEWIAGAEEMTPGRPLSAQHRDKISVTLSGRRLSPAMRAAISAAVSAALLERTPSPLAVSIDKEEVKP